MQPNLKFTKVDAPEGFTFSGVQGFNDISPDAIVRELIQNSMDAVREDNRTKTIVQFKLEKDVKLIEIPGIDNYTYAVKKAIKDQKELLYNGELPDQVKAVVDTINLCISNDTLSVLSVMDNGF